MLTNYTWCIPILTKEAYKEVHAYVANIYSMFGGSHKLLSDNGTEFMNKLLAQVASTMGIKQIFSSLYYPQGKAHIENVYDSLKMFMWKHVSSILPWDTVVHMTCAAYNFVPIEHSRDIAFSL